MKSKILVLIVCLAMLTSGNLVYANSGEEFAVGESINLNTRTQYIPQGELNLNPTQSIGLFAAEESKYQENIGALVVAIAFSDTAETDYADLDKINQLLNGESGSLKKLFEDVSGGKVTYQAQIHQEVIKDSHPRAYYERYMQYLNPVGFQFNPDGTGSSQVGMLRLRSLITNALDKIPGENLNTGILNGNGDSEIDNVIVLFPGPTGKWGDLLWPQSTDISTVNESVRVPYPLYDSSKEPIIGVGEITFQDYDVNLDTLYHETCHSLGLNDMYNYKDRTKDFGERWTPMSSGKPYGMNAIERESLGWLEPEAIVPTDEAKEYTLKALAKENGNAYKIATGYGQYIYLEYRKKDGNLEQAIPESGMLAWRYDETLANVNGNAYGPPYYQYLYRPFGDENAKTDTGNSAFSQNTGRTAMGVGTSMQLFLPDYEEVEITEETPAGENEVVFKKGSKRVVFRLQDTYDSNISIYDITENGDDTLTFTIKSGKPDTLVSDPEFSHMPGSYTENIALTLTSPDEADIYYTTDGTDPTKDSNLYESPIPISGAVTVKAVCLKNDVYSNIVEAKYYCYTNDGIGALPSYDGKGNNQFKLSVTDNDVVHIRFEDLKDETVSGTIVVYDAVTGEGGRFNAKELFGKAVRLLTNGTVIIVAESENAKFEINGYSGIDEPVSKGNTRTQISTDGKAIRVSTILKNNTKVPQTAKTMIALYDDNNMLLQAKAVNEALYNSPYSYLTGADFDFSGAEKKCRLYVWNDMSNLTPLLYEFNETRIVQE